MALTGRRIYKLEAKYILPAGFQLCEEKNYGENLLLALGAQDDKNNWMFIAITAENANRIGEKNMEFEDKSVTFDTWRSNWESKARLSKIPRKPQSVTLGPIRGKGYKLLTGNVENFRGTFTGSLTTIKGWRVTATVETRGRGYDVFEKQMKTFFKKLKIKPLKK